MENVEEKYKFLRYTEKPDRDVEYFWYIFKDFLLNIASRYPISKNPKFLVDTLSSKFNNLQREKAYDKIQSIIKKVIEDVGWILSSSHADSHTSHLFLTFVKRWSKWASPEFSLKGSESFALFKIHMISFSLDERRRKVLFDLLEDLTSSENVFEEDLEELFLFGIKTGKASVIDALQPLLDFERVAMKYFGTKVHKLTKGPKVIRLLKGYERKSQETEIN